MELLVILGIVGVTALAFISIYNRIVALVQRRKNAFSDIDVQLKLRHELIPNLVATVQGYAAHEKGLLERVTEARASALRGGSIGERVKAEQVLGGAVMGIMGIAENYPQLKADSSFVALQGELSDIENKISAARRFFNNATSEYNTSITQFPAVLLARMFGFKEEVFFEVDAAEKAAISAPPKVDFGGK